MEKIPIMQSKSSIIKLCVSSVIVILIAVIAVRYLTNDEFRNEIDTKVLKREISESTSNIIEINSDDNPYVYAYDKYIVVLGKNVLSFYNKDSTLVSSEDVNITTPYFASNEQFLLVADNGGNNLFLFVDTGVKWERQLDGEIYRVSVNKNGYVSVIMKNSLYKSIVVVFDMEGNELFRTYVKTSYAICSEISNNNKVLAIGQIDYSGAIVKSVVKLINIETVDEDLQNSTIYTYESESNIILNNINFNNKNEAICMFDSYIQKVTSASDERIYSMNDDSIFVDVNLDNNIVILEKESTGIFSHEYQVNLKSTNGKSDNIYMLENNAPKSLKVTNDLICINFVNEVRIVNSSGWLLKHYVTNSEIQSIVAGDSIVGIVYNNKVEVIGV